MSTGEQEAQQNKIEILLAQLSTTLMDYKLLFSMPICPQTDPVEVAIVIGHGRPEHQSHREPESRRDRARENSTRQSELTSVPNSDNSLTDTQDRHLEQAQAPGPQGRSAKRLFGWGGHPTDSQESEAFNNSTDMGQPGVCPTSNKIDHW